jgi:hypothetical protein
MSLRFSRIAALGLAGLPLALAIQQVPSQGPTSDQVFANIKVFKGVPAKDLIPAMEFMAASLKMECTDCHDANDYSKDNQRKNTAREMVTMQRELNAKYFGGKLEVTCMSCHNGREHPLATPIPMGVNLRHERIENPPKAEDLFARHRAAVGIENCAIIRTGTLNAPFGEKGAMTESAVEFIQANGKFRMTSGFGKLASDGTQVWRDGGLMTDEPAAIFERIGRSWRGEKAFAGLERISVSGKEVLGKVTTTVVRGTRTSTGSTEELYFDNKTGLLVRFTNVTRSTLGAVVTLFDYSDYKSVKGVKVPMKVEITFAGSDERSTFKYKTATLSSKVVENAFSGSKP